MEGIQIEGKDSFFKVRVSKFTDELKDAIRKDLSNICYGENNIEEYKDIIDYSYTLNDFFSRYDEKTAKQKKGIIGELITHVILTNCFSCFSRLSVLFNKEEKSMRKGFDIVVFNNLRKTLWYTEVKSGECCSDKSKCNYIPNTCNKKAINKNLALLKLAKDDIVERFDNGSQHIWFSAMVDLNSTLQSNSRDSVRELLKKDFSSHKDKKQFDKRVILTSVLFEEKGKDQLASLEVYYKSLLAEKAFSEFILLSIQKDTYQAVEHFLRTEIGGSGNAK